MVENKISQNKSSQSTVDKQKKPNFVNGFRSRKQRQNRQSRHSRLSSAMKNARRSYITPQSNHKKVIGEQYFSGEKNPRKSILGPQFLSSNKNIRRGNKEVRFDKEQDQMLEIPQAQNIETISNHFVPISQKNWRSQKNIVKRRRGGEGRQGEQAGFRKFSHIRQKRKDWVGSKMKENEIGQGTDIIEDPQNPSIVIFRKNFVYE